MTNYNEVIRFGESGDFAVFLLVSINETFKQSTLKSKIGNGYSSTLIPLRERADDLILSVSGIINGEDRSSTQTKEERIQWVKDKLVEYNDGDKHTYEDTVHSINAVIQKGSLVFNDNNRQQDQPLSFNVIFEQWQE